MVDNILTNYNKKFFSGQIDHESISKSKLFYKIYNNKISEPLHKFWFSVPNIKYANNYSEYKTIRFFMNNKNEQISNLINFIKDIGECFKKKINEHFPDITIDYPWKESEQFPFTFSFFTNNSTLFLDQNDENITYNSLSNENTYSIIFEINNLRILPIKLDNNETFSLKINLSLVLIKTDKKKDIKNLISKFFTGDSSVCLDNNAHIQCMSASDKTLNNTTLNKPLFLADLTLGKNKLNKIDDFNNNFLNTNKNHDNIGKPSNLIINQEQLLEVKNTLKKINISKINKEDDSDDNDSNLKTVYLEQKNNLKKVNTNEKSLLKHLKSHDEQIEKKKKKDKDEKKKKKKDDKKKKKLEKEQEQEELLERELEAELEKEFQTQIKK
jgi:hypothetical protein